MPGGKHKSQEARILEVLVKARGGWVPAPELAAISLQYSARVHSLRRAGFAIDNRVTTVDGAKHGAFRLRAGMPQGKVAAPAASPLESELFPVEERAAFRPTEACSRDELARMRRRSG